MQVTQSVYVESRPTKGTDHGRSHLPPNYELTNNNNEQVISVRITSSVAVGRGKGKRTQTNGNSFSKNKTPITSPREINEEERKEHDIQNYPPNLIGANIEFIKQLNAKKDVKDHNYNHQPQQFQISVNENNNENEENDKTSHEIKENKNNYRDSTTIETITSVTTSNLLHESNEYQSPSLLDDALKLSEERLNPIAANDEQTNADTSTTAQFTSEFTVGDFSGIDESVENQNSNETADSVAEPSIKSLLGLDNTKENSFENIENVPLARSSKNYIQGFTNKPPSEREPSARLTTVSFNVVHEPPNSHSLYNDRSHMDQSHSYNQQQKLYETQKIYSQPAQIYSEPAKFYSEPAKIYSEPAKIYGEPAKIYSEPAKIYSEPAKFYSEPASLHLTPNVPHNRVSWLQHSSSSTTLNTTPLTTITYSDVTNPQRIPEHQPERNYEVDEKVSVLTDGRSHGIQESSTEKCKQDNCKVGYVVKGREYNKYRVEERTSDGFIVGEYGVVRNEDGALRGVRYTADSEASPRLIYDALMKFLQLK